jgi:hypothetical protein
MQHLIVPIQNLLRSHTHITGTARMQVCLSTMDFSIDDHIGFALIFFTDENLFIGTVTGTAVVHDHILGTVLPEPRFDGVVNTSGNVEVSVAPSLTDIHVHIIE